MSLHEICSFCYLLCHWNVATWHLELFLLPVSVSQMSLHYSVACCYLNYWGPFSFSAENVKSVFGQSLISFATCKASGAGGCNTLLHLHGAVHGASLHTRVPARFLPGVHRMRLEAPGQLQLRDLSTMPYQAWVRSSAGRLANSKTDGWNHIN